MAKANDHSNRSLVTDFIVESVPAGDVQALERLAELPYPLTDHASFVDCLTPNGKEPTAVDRHLLEIFVPATFPVMTPRGAFERFRDWPRPDLGPLPLPELPAPPIERPSACEIFVRDFGSDCGAQACAAYVQALRSGASEWQAILIGVGEGRRCRAAGPTFGPIAPPWPPWPRPRPWPAPGP